MTKQWSDEDNIMKRMRMTSGPLEGVDHFWGDGITCLHKLRIYPFGNPDETLQ